MTRTLDVYLHDTLVGYLQQNPQGRMSFQYAETWLSNPKAVAISRSLPLRAERFPQKACQGYFGGILPEERKRELVARNLGISVRNDYAMLEAIGGECAGAVTFVPAGGAIQDQGPGYKKLTPPELAQILRDLPRKPLLAGHRDVRLSLAGAQDKIAVMVSGQDIFLPLGGAPSTNILKPAIEHFEGLVFNEALCMQLAGAMGLPVAEVEVRCVEEIDYLLIQRYDRRESPVEETNTSQSQPRWRRLHQEDFCQALGVVSERKYQTEGGPSLARCFALLREVSTTPVIDLQRFLDAVIFNVLIGNHDAHAKNFSLIYEPSGSSQGGWTARLAPLYDLVCTSFYPEITTRMAMRIGDEYSSEKLRPRHFEQMAKKSGLAVPPVLRRVTELAETTRDAITRITVQHPVASEVQALIHGRCEQMLTVFREPTP